jgi:hypothetical protein
VKDSRRKVSLFDYRIHRDLATRCCSQSAVANAWRLRVSSSRSVIHEAGLSCSVKSIECVGMVLCGRSSTERPTCLHHLVASYAFSTPCCSMPQHNQEDRYVDRSFGLWDIQYPFGKHVHSLLALDKSDCTVRTELMEQPRSQRLPCSLKPHSDHEQQCLRNPQANGRQQPSAVERFYS